MESNYTHKKINAILSLISQNKGKGCGQMSKKSGAIRTVTIMMIITFAGKALGLLRDSTVGSYYGAGSVVGAAFNYASVLPRQFLDILFSSAVSASFIPVFNEVLEKQGRDKAFKLSHNFISVILSASVLVTIALMVLSGPVIRAIYGNGNSAEAIALGADLLRIMLLTIVISCLAFSLTGVLQSLGEFNAPAAMGLVSNAVILAYFFLFMDRFGVYGLCVAYVAGWLAQLLIQLPFLIKNKFGFRFHIDLHDGGLKRIGLMMLPVMIGTWVTPINIVVNGNAAQMDSYGIQSYNAITYANNLYTVLSGVLVLSVTNVIFPKLSVQAANADLKSFGTTMSQTIRALLFLLVPLSFGLAALSEPIIRIFYERGNFTSFDTYLTSSALIFFSVGICGFGLQNILIRGFYAFQDGKTPMLTSILAIAANFALSMSLVKVMGTGGPALASSVSITLAAAVMLWVLNRKVKGIAGRRLLIDVLKMLFMGLVMYAAVFYARDYLTGRLTDNSMGRIGVIAIPAAAGAVIYAGLSLLLRLPEAAVFLGMIKRFIRKD